MLFCSVSGTFYRLVLIIDSVVYRFVNWMYRIFFVVSSGQLFSDAMLQNLFDRVNVIIGVVMLFIVSFTLLKNMSNPDNLTKGEGAVTKIIPNILITLVLLVMVPYGFRLAYKVQKIILDTNFVGRIILGVGSNSNSDNMQDAGMNVAADVFSAFLIDSDTNREDPYKGDYKDCGVKDKDGNAVTKFYSIDQISAGAKQTNDFCTFRHLSEELGEDGTLLDYQVIISTFAGVFVLYIFLSFALDMGVRCGKLAFLQLVAPIPILLRIVPKQEEKFKKWLSVTLSTFLSVFVKIAIIFFVIFLITNLDGVFDTFMKSSKTDNFIIRSLARVIIILGLLMFAKEAPKLLEEALGIKLSGQGIGIRKKLSEGLPDWAKGAAVGAGAGMAAGTRNLKKGIAANKGAGFKGGMRTAASTIGGLAGGTRRGFNAGKSVKDWKDFKGAANKGADDAIVARESRKNKSFKDRMDNKLDNVKTFFGGGGASELLALAEQLKKPVTAYDKLKELVQNKDSVKSAQSTTDAENQKLQKEFSEGKGYFDPTKTLGTLSAELISALNNTKLGKDYASAVARGDTAEIEKLKPKYQEKFDKYSNMSDGRTDEIPTADDFREIFQSLSRDIISNGNAVKADAERKEIAMMASDGDPAAQASIKDLGKQLESQISQLSEVKNNDGTTTMDSTAIKSIVDACKSGVLTDDQLKEIGKLTKATKNLSSSYEIQARNIEKTKKEDTK